MNPELLNHPARRWASPPFDVQDLLEASRLATPVSLIATPRDRLKCVPRASWPAVIEADLGLSAFDQIPLTTADGQHIEAIFVRPGGITPLHEQMFMSAREPLVSFLETADTHRFRLLVDGTRIVGIVTLSDLQKLPVYSTLFGLIAGVELMLVEWIRRASEGDDNLWLQHLTRSQRGSIEKYRSQAVAKNLEIERLSHASFGQEITAAMGMGLFENEPGLRLGLKQLVQLRHHVCHASEFAGTPAEALKLPCQVRTLQRLTLALAKALHLQ